MKLAEAFMKWRQNLVTVEQVESTSLFDHEEPFTDNFKDWREFKEKIKPGDELWSFRSPDEEWEKFMGWQGLVPVRDGQLIEVCVTAQN